MASLDIDKLKPGAKYNVQVRAIYPNSLGEWSNVYTFSTPSATVPTSNTTANIKLDGGAMYAGSFPNLPSLTSASGVIFNKDGLFGYTSGSTSFAITASAGDAYFAGTVSANAGQVGMFKIAQQATGTGYDNSIGTLNYSYPTNINPSVAFNLFTDKTYIIDEMLYTNTSSADFYAKDYNVPTIVLAGTSESASSTKTYLNISAEGIILRNKLAGNWSAGSFLSENEILNGNSGEFKIVTDNPTNYAPSRSAELTNNSASVIVDSTSDLRAGMQVVGTGIPFAATVASVVSSSVITLDSTVKTSGSSRLLFADWSVRGGDGPQNFGSISPNETGPMQINNESFFNSLRTTSSSITVTGSTNFVPIITFNNNVAGNGFYKINAKIFFRSSTSTTGIKTYIQTDTASSTQESANLLYKVINMTADTQDTLYINTINDPTNSASFSTTSGSTATYVLEIDGVLIPNNNIFSIVCSVRTGSGSLTFLPYSYGKIEFIGKTAEV